MNPSPEFLAGLSAVCAVVVVIGAVFTVAAALDASEHRHKAAEAAKAAEEAARNAADIAEWTARPVTAFVTDPLQADAVEPLPEEPPPAGPRRRGRAAILRAYHERGGIAELYRDHGNPVG